MAVWQNRYNGYQNGGGSLLSRLFGFNRGVGYPQMPQGGTPVPQRGPQMPQGGYPPQNMGGMPIPHGGMPHGGMPHQNMPPAQNMPPMPMAGPNQAPNSMGADMIMPAGPMPAGPIPAGMPAQGMPAQSLMGGTAPQSPQGPVTYEPLDEETLKQVQKLIEKKRAEESGGNPTGEKDLKPNGEIPPGKPLSIPNPASAPTAPSLSTPQSSNASLLEELIQGERNAALFYKGLAEKNQGRANVFGEISVACGKRKDSLISLYRDINGGTYTPKDSGVISHIELSQAVKLAIETERESIGELRKLYGGLKKNSHLSTVNNVIYAKLMDISRLQDINLS